jgi:hypothetical protein
MIRRVALSITLALAAFVLQPSHADAQVMPTFTTGTYDSIQKQFYRYQQYLNESSTALNEYQQFMQAYTNYTKYHIGGLVQVLTPLMGLQQTIEGAMNNGTDPKLAAELKRNQIVQQNISLIDNLTHMTENGAVTTTQLTQTSNEILSTIAADNLAQRQVDYAKAQAAIQRQNNLTIYHQQNAGGQITP